jgi:peroxiredoxin
MIELGQLEAARAEFEKRGARVIVASIEGPEEARQTQEQFPHLTVVADSSRALAQAVAVIHPESDPTGGDTAAPTTLIVDGFGTVRWTFRPHNVFRRLSPAELFEALDEQMKSD